MNEKGEEKTGLEKETEKDAAVTEEAPLQKDVSAFHLRWVESTWR